MSELEFSHVSTQWVSMFALKYTWPGTVLPCRYLTQRTWHLTWKQRKAFFWIIRFAHSECPGCYVCN